MCHHQATDTYLYCEYFRHKFGKRVVQQMYFCPDDDTLATKRVAMQSMCTY